MRYKVEQTYIVNQCGGVLYPDISDLTPRQAERLAQLHTENDSMDWETAWETIQAEEEEAAHVPQPYQIRPKEGVSRL